MRETAPALWFARARLPRTDLQSSAHRAATFSEPAQTQEVAIEPFLKFVDARVLFDTGTTLVCLVDGIQVRIPSHLMRSGTEVHATGDHGTLVIPRSLALSVGLI